MKRKDSFYRHQQQKQLLQQLKYHFKTHQKQLKQNEEEQNNDGDDDCHDDESNGSNSEANLATLTTGSLNDGNSNFDQSGGKLSCQEIFLPSSSSQFNRVPSFNHGQRLSSSSSGGSKKQQPSTQVRHFYKLLLQLNNTCSTENLIRVT